MKTASRFPDHPPVDIVAGRNREVNAASERSVMRMLRIAGLICMLLSMVHQNVQAQTEWKENYVTLANDEQTNPSLAMPSNSAYTVVVWEDSRDSGGTVTDIYAQKIDNINGLPQWLPVDGVPVCRAPYGQYNPRAAFDTLGHVMIVWEDARCDTTNFAIYAQCLEVSDGSIVTNWLTDGNRVSDTTQHAERPRIVGTGDGAYIAWEDWRNWHSSHSDSLHRDIYLQFLYSATATYPQGGTYSWIEGGIHVPLANSYDDRNVELDRDSHWMQAQDTKDRDGVILAYESKRTISSTTGDSVYIIYANCIDPNGDHNTDWGGTWSNSDARCASSDEEQLNPRIVVEGREHGLGDSTFAIVWQDAREHPDTPVKYHIIGQVMDRITGERIGTSTGIEICTIPGTQQHPELTIYEESEDPAQSIPYFSRVICVWEDLRDYVDNGVDVYCAVMDGTDGNIVTAGGTAGDAVAIPLLDQDQPKVDHYPDDAEAFIVWRSRLTSDDIWYTSIDLETLNFSQTAGLGKEVSGAKGDQVNPQVGGDVFVFADYRRKPILYDGTEDWNIYAETPGECVGPKDMNWRDMFAEVTPYGDAEHMRLALDDNHNTFVVWQEAGAGGGTDVYIQKLDVDGVPRWPNSGIKLNTSEAFNPDVTVSDSIGGAQAVWQQSSGGADSVYYAKLSPTGAIAYRASICEGFKPVIDYTDSVYYHTGSTHLEPPNFHAMIAAVKSTGDVDVCWNGSGTGWEHEIISSIQWDAREVQMCSTLSGGYYLSIIGVSARTKCVVPVCGHNERGGDYTVGGTDLYAYFYGADIDRDENSIYGNGHKNGCIVVCGGATPNTDLVSYHLNADAGNAISAKTVLTAVGADEAARYPSICPDSSLNPMNNDAGILVAWDWEWNSAGNQVHDVYTNRLSSVAGNWVLSDPASIRLLSSNDSAFYPDIARLRGCIGDTTAFIVFEFEDEICSPNRPIEVSGNWVIYDSSSVYRGVKWCGHKQMGPGAGSYTQRHPRVLTSVDGSVNVFWYDSRGSTDLVMGTRSWPVDSIDIEWGKKAEERYPLPVANVRLGENYPNPVSLNRSATSYVSVDVRSECNVVIELYDNLGRLVGAVHDGYMSTGTHILDLDVGHLRPGMYHYLLRTDTGLETRGMIVIR